MICAFKNCFLNLNGCKYNYFLITTKKYFKKGEKQTVDEYFYDELSNCIKRASHLIIPMVEHQEFMYTIYKYEFY